MGPVTAYLGIPYARTGGQAGRLRPATVCESMDLVPSKRHGPAALQLSRLRLAQSEEALYLNIWVPHGPGPFPVYFYIHGGGFRSGSGADEMIQGELLAKRGQMIVVTINYRLGFLGFGDFRFFDDEALPNPGLDDVKCALRFIAKQIHHLGGDPAAITVAGESAGGCLAACLPLDPALRPLIAKLSLSSMIPSAFHAPEMAQAIARDFCKTQKIQDAKALHALRPGQFLAKQRRYERQRRFGQNLYLPVVDGTVLPDFPLIAAREGAYAGLPALLGSTGDELSFVKYRRQKKRWAVDRYQALGASKEDPDWLASLEAAYQAAYPEDKEQIQLASDAFVRASMASFAKDLSQEAWLALWRLEWYGPLQRLTGLKAMHVSDLLFSFGVPFQDMEAGLSPRLSSQLGRGVLFADAIDVAWKISQAMQDDLADFVHGRPGRWKPLDGQAMNAKSYQDPIGEGVFLPPKLLALWEQSHFFQAIYKGSFFDASYLALAQRSGGDADLTK